MRNYFPSRYKKEIAYFWSEDELEMLIASMPLRNMGKRIEKIFEKFAFFQLFFYLISPPEPKKIASHYKTNMYISNL